MCVCFCSFSLLSLYLFLITLLSHPSLSPLVSIQIRRFLCGGVEGGEEVKEGGKRRGGRKGSG